jgi:acetyl-CoA carboxylase carboxyl transferase subunit alpha
MAVVEVPIVVMIISEGASGGALGIGLGDRVYMLENSWYSVISPEGCAAILWKADAGSDPAKLEVNRKQAAEALKPIASDLEQLQIIDKIIPEPPGGAHMDYKETAKIIKGELIKAISELKDIPSEKLCIKRLEKYRQMGVYKE